MNDSSEFDNQIRLQTAPNYNRASQLVTLKANQDDDSVFQERLPNLIEDINSECNYLITNFGSSKRGQHATTYSHGIAVRKSRDQAILADLTKEKYITPRVNIITETAEGDKSIQMTDQVKPNQQDTEVLSTIQPTINNVADGLLEESKFSSEHFDLKQGSIQEQQVSRQKVEVNKQSYITFQEEMPTFIDPVEESKNQNSSSDCNVNFQATVDDASANIDMQNFQALAQSNMVTVTNKSSVQPTPRKEEQIVRALNIVDAGNEMTEESIMGRMPKNYFVQDVEHVDIGDVVNEIKDQRDGFLKYMEENNLQHEFGDISHLMHPEQFIEKHLGVHDMQMLMEQEIDQEELDKKLEQTPEPDPTLEDVRDIIQEESKLSIVENKLEEDSKLYDLYSDTEGRLLSARESQELIHPMIVNEEDDEDEEEDQEQNLNDSRERLNQGSSAKSTIKSPKVPELNKAADYFKEDHRLNMSPKQLDQSQRQELVQKLEKGLIDKLDVNMLFSEGEMLKTSLIVAARLYIIIEKIREVSQAEKVDLVGIVEFLKQSESQVNQKQYYQEPQKSYLSPELQAQENQQKWIEICTYLRQNPKLMLQMIPDDPQSNQNNKNSHILEDQEESKKWAKLQKLSRRFMRVRQQEQAYSDNDGTKILKGHGAIINLSDSKPSRVTSSYGATNRKTNRQYKIVKKKKQPTQLVNRSNEHTEAVRDSAIYYKSDVSHGLVSHDPTPLSKFIPSSFDRPQTQKSVRPVTQVVKKGSVSTVGDGTTLGTSAAHLHNFMPSLEHDALTNKQVRVYGNKRPITAVSQNMRHRKLLNNNLSSRFGQYNTALSNINNAESHNQLISLNQSDQVAVPSDYNSGAYAQYIEDQETAAVLSSNRTSGAPKIHDYISRYAPNLKDDGACNLLLKKFKKENGQRQMKRLLSAQTRTTNSNQRRSAHTQRRNLNITDAGVQTSEFSMYKPESTQKRKASQRSQGLQTSEKMEEKQLEESPIGIGQNKDLEIASDKNRPKKSLIDWSLTPLFSQVIENDTLFNKDQDITFFIESEVDYVLDMMKNKYQEFKRSDIIRPFYLKAQHTLARLFQEIEMVVQYSKLMNQYNQITLENTVKLLIRCKLLFSSRNILIQIFKNIINYELQVIFLKEQIEKHADYRLIQAEFDSIHQNSELVFKYGSEFLKTLSHLKENYQQFRGTFIFKKKDFQLYVKQEMNEIRKLMSVYKVKKEDLNM